MAINFTHVVQRGESLSGIIMQHTGFSAWKSGQLAVAAAEASSVDVYSTDEWAEQHNTKSEKICDKIFGKGEQRATCQQLRFIDIKPGQKVSFSLENGKLKLEIRDADAEPVVRFSNLTDLSDRPRNPDVIKEEEPPPEEPREKVIYMPDEVRYTGEVGDIPSQWVITPDLTKYDDQEGEE